MTSKPEETTARKIAHAVNESRFENYGYDAKACAQRNLSGRTHYVDDNTLRFFHSRINSARPEMSGLVLVLIESVAADFRNRSRGFRFVVFDLFGSVINDRAGHDSLLRTSEQARKAASAWLRGFDVLAHYRDAMTERAGRLARDAAALTACASDLSTPAP
jgi:hypothetical protein